MSEPDIQTSRPADPRVPVDRSNITKPGQYYAHVIKGNCPVHGLTACECVHPSPDAKQDALEIHCITCMIEKAEKGD